MQLTEREEMEMTLEELKAEAKAHGYKLIKDNPRPKLLKCTCGRNNFGRWTRPSENGSCGYQWKIECRKCGKASKWADSEREAIEMWNEMIKREMDDD